jgi:hypothetical protein
MPTQQIRDLPNNSYQVLSCRAQRERGSLAHQVVAEAMHFGVHRS